MTVFGFGAESHEAINHRAFRAGPFSSNSVTEIIDPNRRQSALRTQCQRRHAMLICDQKIRTEWPWPSETGTDLIVEVDVEAGRPLVRGGGTSSSLERAAQTFETGVARIAPVAAGIIAQLSGAVEGVGEVTVKFGVKFSAEAGAFIASVSSDANFEVGLKWVSPAKK